MRRLFSVAASLAIAALGMPAMMAPAHEPALAVVTPVSARKRARRAALVASGYSLKRSKGRPDRRTVKSNRLHISRRTRRRHRRNRRRA